MRPVGWRYESHRHSLAARGVKTRKYFMPFTKDTTIPAVEYPQQYKYNLRVEKKLMSPDEIIEMFDKASPGFSERYSRHAEREVARLVEGHKRGDSLQAPVMYLEKENGKWAVPRDGMHDHFEVVLAAKAAGEKEIPMVVVYRRPQDEKGRYVFSDSEKKGFEKQEEIMGKAPIYTEQKDNVITMKSDVSGIDREEEKYLDDSNIHEAVVVDAVPKEFEKQPDSEWEWARRRREREEKEGRTYEVKKIDLKRYAGTWKQKSVKNEPWFQRGCKDVKAQYTVKGDGTVRVVNTCDGRKIEGTARSVSADNRKLQVDFGFPFRKGDYIIKSVNKDYTKAVVKSGKTEWVLTR